MVFGIIIEKLPSVEKRGK